MQVSALIRAAAGCKPRRRSLRELLRLGSGKYQSEAVVAPPVTLRTTEPGELHNCIGDLCARLRLDNIYE